MSSDCVLYSPMASRPLAKRLTFGLWSSRNVGLSEADLLLFTADNAQGPEPFKSSAYDCLLPISNGDQYTDH